MTFCMSYIFFIRKSYPKLSNRVNKLIVKRGFIIHTILLCYFKYLVGLNISLQYIKSYRIFIPIQAWNVISLIFIVCCNLHTIKGVVYIFINMLIWKNMKVTLTWNHLMLRLKEINCIFENFLQPPLCRQSLRRHDVPRCLCYVHWPEHKIPKPHAPNHIYNKTYGVSYTFRAPTCSPRVTELCNANKAAFECSYPTFQYIVRSLK